jgi:DICT domain-containing protein
MTAEAANARLAELLAVEPDLHALMLATVRAWAERYAADAQSASVLVDRGIDKPMDRCVVSLAASSSQPAV